MKKKFSDIIGWFQANVPVAESELRFDNPWQLLVAVMLSAQCTDKRVNLVAPPLFERFPSPADMASSSVEEILNFVKSVSYPNSKAAHLLGTAQKLVSDFGGSVPGSLEELQTLPGVGRKTANVVTSIIWNNPVIAVDTHVFRVAHRTGLSRGKDVLKVEKDLTDGIPASIRPKAHHWLLLHGRYVCTARSPKCSQCGIAPFCNRFRKQNKGN